MIADVNDRQRERHRVVRNASDEPARAAPGAGDRPDAVTTLTPRGHGREVGAILIVLGVIALREGHQLYALREALVAGAIVGDDTMLVAVGIALVLIGVFLLFARLPPVIAALPRGPIRTQMISAAGVLVAYWLIVPWLGYTASTGLVAMALFRTMGRYSWPAAALFGALTTGALYLMFRVWLLQPLPSGVLGI
jgi:hypothetical protein